MRFTSYLSCEEAKNALVVWEQQKDYCRYPTPDPTVVDATSKSAQSERLDRHAELPKSVVSVQAPVQGV